MKTTMSLLLLLLAAVPIGCSRDTTTVEGRVTLDGNPLEEGKIRFEPDAERLPRQLVDHRRIRQSGISLGVKLGLEPTQVVVTFIAAGESGRADHGEIGQPSVQRRDVADQIGLLV